MSEEILNQLNQASNDSSRHLERSWYFWEKRDYQKSLHEITNSISNDLFYWRTMELKFPQYEYSIGEQYACLFALLKFTFLISLCYKNLGYQKKSMFFWGNYISIYEALTGFSGYFDVSQLENYEKTHPRLEFCPEYTVIGNTVEEEIQKVFDLAKTKEGLQQIDGNDETFVQLRKYLDQLYNLSVCPHVERKYKKSWLKKLADWISS